MKVNRTSTAERLRTRILETFDIEELLCPWCRRLSPQLAASEMSTAFTLYLDLMLLLSTGNTEFNTKTPHKHGGAELRARRSRHKMQFEAAATKNWVHHLQHPTAQPCLPPWLLLPLC